MKLIEIDCYIKYFNPSEEFWKNELEYLFVNGTNIHYLLVLYLLFT